MGTVRNSFRRFTLILPPHRFALSVLVVFALTTGAVQAADKPSTEFQQSRSAAKPEVGTGRKLWLSSVGAMAIAGGMDINSSWGKCELNSNLSGDNQTFGTRGALMKLGIGAGIVGIEYLILRRSPSPKLFRALSIVNFGGAAATGAVAVRNYGVPKQ